MTHKTKGIVLRSIKYGETSLIVTIFTELFGIQTYMANGVRSAKKNTAKAMYFQPAAMLEMVVYHNELRPMQRLKDYHWDYLYQEVFGDVIKNNIALYIVELLYKCLKQPEQNTDLFFFTEDILHSLDTASRQVTANFPLFYTLHLPHFFGFKMQDNFDEDHTVLDLEEGYFISAQPHHPNYISGEAAQTTSQLLKVMQPHELEEFRLNSQIRRSLLIQYQNYYMHHIQDFGQLKTLLVLHEVL